MQNHIDTILKFITDQMDGETVASIPSNEMTNLEEAVRAIQTANSDYTWTMLGMKSLGAVASRMHAHFAAQAALGPFIRGGDHA